MAMAALSHRNAGASIDPRCAAFFFSKFIMQKGSNDFRIKIQIFGGNTSLSQERERTSQSQQH
jgi:hypothetical protein